MFLSAAASEVAPGLLGWILVREINGKRLSGKIVETEAYDETDAASHSYRGKTPRTDVMFGPPGRAYVYFTYGMHYCFNVVTGESGVGSAVLIRALEPLEGHEQMKKLRDIDDPTQLTNGPAKLCQALGIDVTLNGHDLSQSPLRLEKKEDVNPDQIVATTRIGITRDTHRPWRFYVKANPWVSKK